MESVIIVGTGPAGIGAASELHAAGRPFRMIERQDGLGGLGRTDRRSGFLFDRAGHFLHARSSAFGERLAHSGVRLQLIERRSAIIMGERVVPYPIQYNLWAFNPADQRAIVAELTRPAPATSPSAATLMDALCANWGETLVARFFRPYNEKMLGKPLAQVPADCLGRFVPTTSIELMLESRHGPIDGLGYNAQFLYPASGRIGDLFDALARDFSHHIRFCEEVVSIDAMQRRCLTSRSSLAYDVMISSMPLPLLVAKCGMQVPASMCFDHVDICNLRIAFRGSVLRPVHWLYIPDPAVPFYRVGFPSNVNPATCPPETSSLSIEYRIPGQGEPQPDPDVIARQALDYLHDLGIIHVYELLFSDAMIIAPAYVLHRSVGRPEFDSLFETLEAHGIFSIGRYGRWDYLSMEDSFLDGKAAAQRSMLARLERS